MNEYEKFCKSLSNMSEIYNYQEPYNNVIRLGIVWIYRITFEQSWKMMKEIFETMVMKKVLQVHLRLY